MQKSKIYWRLILITVIILLAIIAIFSFFHFGKEYKTQESCQAIQIDLEPDYENLTYDDLLSLNGGAVDVRNDPATSIPKEINGIFSTHKVKSAEDAVMAMMSVRDYMHITGKSFCCTEIDDSRSNTTMYVLYQLYHNVVVDSGMFRIYASREDGTPVAITGTYRQNIEVDTTPQLSSKEAAQSVERTLEIQKPIQLVIYMDGGSPRLCWKISVCKKGSPIETKILYLSAENGETVAEIATAMP